MSNTKEFTEEDMNDAFYEGAKWHSENIRRNIENNILNIGITLVQARENGNFRLLDLLEEKRRK